MVTVLPAHGVEVVRYSLSRRIAEKLLFGGQIYPAFKALDMEVLDELIEAERLVERAAERTSRRMQPIP